MLSRLGKLERHPDIGALVLVAFAQAGRLKTVLLVQLDGFLENSVGFEEDLFCAPLPGPGDHRIHQQVAQAPSLS